MGRKHFGKRRNCIFKRLVMKTHKNQGLFGKVKPHLQEYDSFPFSFLFIQAEEEIKGNIRRIQLLEDEVEKLNSKYEDCASKLEEATKAADESER